MLLDIMSNKYEQQPITPTKIVRSNTKEIIYLLKIKSAKIFSSDRVQYLLNRELFR